MKIHVNITNQYGYDIAIYPYNNGALPSHEKAEVVGNSEEQGSLSVERSESGIIDIPGMGSVLLQFMGEQKLSEYHDKFCEHPDEFDKCEQMVLIRYKTSELYWRFPSSAESAQVDLQVNDVGTVCLGKVSTGSVRQLRCRVVYPASIFSKPNGYTTK